MGVLRQELLGRPVRVSEIDPGMVETEFSLVRFGGDADRAAKVYEGVTPLTADDVAECVRWVASRPSHVNVDQLIVLARDQAGARQVHRAEPGLADAGSWGTSVVVRPSSGRDRSSVPHRAARQRRPGRRPRGAAGSRPGRPSTVR